MQLEKVKDGLWVPTDFKKFHGYYADEKGEKEYTGVTSVLGVLAKPNLIPWAARMACEHIKDFSKPYETRDGGLAFDSAANFYQLLEEARTAHTKKKEAAGTHGTSAHELVELFVKNCLIGDEQLAFNSPSIFGSIQPFVDWAQENVERFLFSERRMFNKELFIAGTADFGCILKTGQKLIGDFKTSSGIYGIDYYLQCAGYKILAEGEGDEKYDGCVIVRLGKKGPKDFDVTYNYDCVTAEKAFLACLTLYRAQAALKETAIRQ